MPRASQASCRPSLHPPARANVPARGVAQSTFASGPLLQGIGFAPEMIARKSDHAAHLIHVQSESQHDRVSDIARIGWPGRDRGVGRILMSAEIIRFTSRIYYTHFGKLTAITAVISDSSRMPFRPRLEGPCFRHDAARLSKAAT